MGLRSVCKLSALSHNLDNFGGRCPRMEQLMRSVIALPSYFSEYHSTNQKYVLGGKWRNRRVSTFYCPLNWCSYLTTFVFIILHVFSSACITVIRRCIFTIKMEKFYQLMVLCIESNVLVGTSSVFLIFDTRAARFTLVWNSTKWFPPKEKGRCIGSFIESHTFLKRKCINTWLENRTLYLRIGAGLCSNCYTRTESFSFFLLIRCFLSLQQ